MKKKFPKLLKISIIVSVILAILYCFRDIVFACVWFIFITAFAIAHIISGLLTPPPPPPQIEYAEFPVELVYEIYGGRYEIKDTLICEYDGWDTTGDGLSKERCWTKRFESGEDEVDDIIIYFDEETTVYLEIFSAKTYMGDKYAYDCYDGSDEPIFYMDIESSYSHKHVTKEELYDELGIKIIEYTMPERIENSFSYLNYFR